MKNRPSDYTTPLIRIFICCLLPLSALHAQDATDVRYDNVQVARQGDWVEVSFKAFVGSRCIGGKGQFLFTPVLYNDKCTLPLPAIAVFSRHADWMEYREELSKRHRPTDTRADTPSTVPTPIAFRSGNNGRVSYRATVAWQPELTDVSLHIEPVLQSSRKRHYRFPAVRISNKLFLRSAPRCEPPKDESPKEEAGKASASKTAAGSSAADSLSKHYPFLLPLAGLQQAQLFDPAMPLRMGKGAMGRQQDAVEQFIASNEPGSLRIHFARSSSGIDRYYKENNASLVCLISVLRHIERSADARIARIVVAGFSSPEGPLIENDRLAWERADAVREFIVTNTNVRFGQISLYNGSEDWRGLRELVEQCAEMESRYDVLRIIDTVPILGGREKQLMDLAGGMPYRYMKRYLFP
ncbi:MAG: hypothetical protein RSB04_12745, partial [Gordonibacter sp.]|uniref:hypothetical protein n=1 Tax=Gordonibacter sp. TaxID=1968902 RepID=UPI002FC65494